jgi:TatD DNase family protein
MCLAKNGRAIIESIPRERVLTETDAPYNEWCDIGKLLNVLAGNWNIGRPEAEAAVERNFRTLLKGLK